ncbi:MAG TPA: glycosyltransferase [Bacteroidetes bacterium]|nr:glycosyltransferase [Bacteroidota bacterium]
MFEFQPATIEYILLVIFAASVLVQLFYYLIFYLRTGTSRPGERKSQNLPVSVIICARNEAENLEVFLPSVLEQDYPDFEVIVVNDCSDDDTEDILEKYARQYEKLKITKIYKESSLRHSKKMALFLGIKAASNEILLLTDADCQPVSENWISSFASSFTESTDFVLGYGGYLKKKGLLNKYIRWDTMFIAMQYTGMAMAGLPYMGVGRNLAYRKSVFFKNKGFGPNLYLQSGDDDLFVNMLAEKKNTTVNLAPESFTRSIPAGSWKEFLRQKTRHLSTASHYKMLTKFLLVTEPLSRLLFYSLLLVLLILTNLYQAIGMAAAAVIICKLISYVLVHKNLNEKDLLVFSPLFDIISPFLNVYFLLNVAFKRHQYYEWK